MSKRLLIEGVHNVHYISLSNIIYCEANNNWTKVYTLGQKTYEVCQTLKQIEERIHSEDFFRTHRSYLVNLLFVKEITGSYELLKLVEEYTIPIARRRRRIFKNKFRTFLLEVL
jgi:two-component system LytT family response regulator